MDTKLAHDFAIKAGLTDTEADEVVQESAIGVARTAGRQGRQACRLAVAKDAA